MLKVALWSSWKTPCGIATYTRDLGNALSDLGHHVVVLSEQGVAATLDSAGFDTLPDRPVWKRNYPDYRTLLDAVRDERPDILHVQHEYGLMPDAEAVIFALGQARAICPVVVTMHTVTCGNRGPGTEHDRKVAFAGDAVITHSWRALDALGHDPYRRVLTCHIPHGTPDNRKGTERALARKALGVPPDAFVVLTTGFLSPDKRWEDTGLALIKLTPKLPSLYWIAGGLGVHESSPRVRAWIESRTVLAQRTLFYDRFLTDADLDNVFGACDVCVLNSGPTPFSISGQSHLAIAYSVPILAADVPLYDDVRSVGQMFNSALDLAGKLHKLSQDSFARDEMEARAIEATQATAWPRVARMHDQLYRRLRTDEMVWRHHAEDGEGRQLGLHVAGADETAGATPDATPSVSLRLAP